MQTFVLNHLANHPDVRPYVSPNHHSVDMSAFAADPRHLAIGGVDGAVLFAAHGEAPGVYEMHWLLTKQVRGEAALRLARRGIDRLFTDRDAVAIVGATPRENRAARMMNRALGGRPTGEVTDSLGRSCITYRLDRASWATSSAASSAALVRS